MFRINSQQPQVTTPTTTASSAQGRSGTTNQLQNLLASLEQAIQQLTQRYGGQHRGGGDGVELPRQGPIAQPSPPIYQGPVARPAPGPVQTQPSHQPAKTFPFPWRDKEPIGIPFPKWPWARPDDGRPGLGWHGECSAQAAEDPGKGRTVGTLGNMA